MKFKLILFTVFSVLFLSSCESDLERKERLEMEALERSIKEEQRLEEERANQLRIAFEENEREISEKYRSNSLPTGATPYSYCYGESNSCSSFDCSQITVKTPYNSDVLVTIKRNNEVYRHAYIRAGASFTFEMPNGTYQPFFYYGQGWNPEKIMKESICGTLKGGFVAAEHVGKDSPQNLNNDILQYELILHQNGNFSTQASNPEEAL